jgi:hypothetical protein
MSTAKTIEGQVLARFGRKGGLQVSLSVFDSLTDDDIMAYWQRQCRAAKEEWGIRLMIEPDPVIIRGRLRQVLVNHGCLL